MMNQFTIPLHKPFWGKEEEKAAILAMRSGIGIGGLSYSDLLTEALSDKLSVRYVLPTASGTAALELACACLLRRGHEVILPSFTFSSCANAIMLSGAKPIFCDIDINTYNIDPTETEKHITSKTRAIMVIHYAGLACDMEKMTAMAKKHNLLIIEDAAHALGSKFKGQFLGTIGDIGCFSFHGTKNAASGEGGVFVTNNKEVYKLAEIIREKGTDRSSFMRGERKKYSWVKVGRSLVLSDILSAIALEQVKKLEKITHLRKRNAKYLLKKLERLSSKIILPKEIEYCDTCWHIFAIRVPKLSRDKVIEGLRSYGIEASFHYLPLHTSVMGKKLGYKARDLPVTEEVATTLIRLPMYPQLKKSELDYMVASLEKIL
ncbi:MAG: TDP-4-keto-6-deoxy-D-glucose transaminase [Candidatus Curtissbacteria bacterium GW2011_GWA1_40_47]|nr:MAG: TDP-4-keto-6-deoxy-D-glucose transaminase [Candidatus Curtissbacteria bacterium GW2011_GWB1_40_28]KKR62376.1 MAG: TDP-4-keto-6-deoxy-D-glucose transaminase [Microgenomates group bacterium GW2011_GWC1_40_35]KKR66423.1 MAG: TDP-4-keto-6-deoxy-D-glucose transaminase [Candidatus Curtissbacteria bacterium GW2011_GWA1_40_47]KKS02544.1 MAG: TDP-4-keto-6-deoxy-D-glucose transaminase [Candidatus Curtissbacteria bacterium GW2011_GWC2_41_21]